MPAVLDETLLRLKYILGCIIKIIMLIICSHMILQYMLRNNLPNYAHVFMLLRNVPLEIFVLKKFIDCIYSCCISVINLIYQYFDSFYQNLYSKLYSSF